MSTIAIDARELRQSTGRYVERLIHYLQQIDTEHDYVILLKPDDMDTWQPTNPRFKKVACPHKEFTFAEQLGFKKQLNQLKPDLVHFASVQQPIWYRRPVVTTMQDLTTVRFRNPTKNYIVFSLKREVYKWVNRRAARKSRLLITPTQYVKDDVVGFTRVSPDKITVTHEAVDDFDEAPAPVPGFEGKRYIMYNGRPLPHKNLRRLIEAFAILAPKYPDLHLMLAGKKNALQDSYVELATKLGVGDRVVLTDWITDGQLKWAMQHAVAYIWPSLSEGFGLPPLEAMLNGTPVVSSNATCMPEVLGEAAYYFDPLSSEDMAAKIGEVVEDPILREELVDKGRQQIQKYSWQRMAEQTLDVYRRALGEK
ncbi:MAG TPA: glycosyltransferase family 1 protein [Candidatus Saccharimonadales bacterium]|nr:glycosyltransferase family 1 protein [Candidatus Saccharimonadales bacterium]